MVAGDAFERSGRTISGDGAFVTVDAPIVSDLEIERSVAKYFTSFDALGTADAQIFIDIVFPIGFLDKHPLDGSRGAELVFRSRGQCSGSGKEIPEAEIAIAADGIGLNAFDGGIVEHTVGSAVFTLNTGIRIDLPDPGL